MNTNACWLEGTICYRALAPCITRVRPTICFFFHSELNTNVCIHRVAQNFFPKVYVCVCEQLFLKEGMTVWGSGAVLTGRASLFVTCVLYSESLPPDTGR